MTRRDLAARLAAGERLVGTIASIADVALAELLAHPFDLVWIDLEHGSLSRRDAQALALATQAAGAIALARVARWDADELPALLDAGVDGIVAPAVEHADQARALVGRLRYPPHGHRGFGPRRAGGYGRAAGMPLAPACVVQVETPSGVDAAATIAAVDGVDAVVVGTADLSFGLGCPQDLAAPELRAAVEQVRSACAHARTAFGVAGSGDLAALTALAGADARLIVYSADVRLYARAVDAVAASLREALAVAAEARADGGA